MDFLSLTFSEFSSEPNPLFIVVQKLCTPIIIIITIFNLIFRLFTIIKYYNLFKTSRTSHKNPLTLEIQTKVNKKEILSRVNSTIWCTRLIKLNIVTVNYRSSRAVMWFWKKSSIHDFAVCVLIVSDNHFEDSNNILMFISIEIIHQMHIVCQFFNNVIDNFIWNRIET
jgi:hypothetical protein